MTKPPLTALLLCDDKPGHYRQAEGVLAAVARLRPVSTARREIRRHRLVPTRTLHGLVNVGVPPALILRLGYGVAASALPSAHLVVSAGGETLAANAAAAKLLGVPNVFCGTLRRMAPEHIRLVIANIETPANPSNFLVSLPPSPIDLSRGPAARGGTRLGRGNPPRLAGVLIGGNSGTFRYSDAEWKGLVRFLREAHAAHGIRWVATTSRRSDGFVADALNAAASEPGSGLVRFIDFRSAGAGTVADIFAEAEAILCTDDSTAMISEAVGACLPVVAVRPKGCVLEPREAAFREHLAHQDWYRALPLARLTPEALLQSLEEIAPRTTSPLDELAGGLRQRLPELFADA